MNILYYDTETTGFPNRNRKMDWPTQPFITQLGALLEQDGKVVSEYNSFVKPDGWIVPPQCVALNGTTTEKCEELGKPIENVLDDYVDMAYISELQVCHNVDFDSLLLKIQAKRCIPDMDPASIFEGSPHICTMKTLTPVCKLKKKDGRTGSKWPTLEEAYKFYFGEMFPDAHDALADVHATRKIFQCLCNDGEADDWFRKNKLIPIRFDKDPRDG